MEVTQTDKAITLDCGCNTSIVLTFDRGELTAVQGTLSHCPLHAAAAKLLAALEPFAALAEDSPPDTPDSHWLYDGCFVGFSLGDARRARRAIDAAKS